MQSLKEFLILFTAAGLILGMFGTAFAEGATRDECIAQCKAAAAMLESEPDAAVQEIANKTGRFVWKDTYVFLMDLNGKMLAHPMKPELTQKATLLDVPDKNPEAPKKLFAEFVEVAKTKGQGWVDYMWPKPGEEKPSLKDTYVYRVPGTDLFVAAGIYK